MKKKNIFLTLGLATVMALGIGAALGHNEEFRATKADEQPTWMFRVLINELNGGADSGLSNFRFHCWNGAGVDVTQPLNFIGETEIGDNKIYAANLSFKESETITGCQFIVTKDGGDYYSNDIAFSLDKDLDFVEYFWKVDTTTLENTKWSVANDEPSVKNYIQVEFDGCPTTNFVADPVHNVFRISNFEITGNETPMNDRYLTLNVNSVEGTSGYNLLSQLLDADSLKSYARFHGTHWISLYEPGTFDFVLCGDNGFSGLRMQRHDSPTSSYIYYVTGENEATANYAYTFGVNQALGTWPGIPVLDIAGVQEVTGNGVVHFQNQNVRIYKIPLNIGNGCDNQIIFNHPGSGSKSSDLYLKPGTALWWTAQYNYTNNEAGKALDLIVRLESIRNAVTAHGDIKAYSVCGISKSDAASLYNEYNSLSSDTKVRYIDSTKIHTYKVDKTEGEEMVSMYDIMLELARIGEIDLSSNNPLSLRNNQTALIIIVIAAVSVCSLAGTFFIIRRRKHN